MNTYESTIDYIKQNKQAEQKQNHGYREHFDDCQIRGGWGDAQKG